MYNQRLTIYKNDSNWTTAADADAVIRSKAGADIIAFYENSKENGHLEHFSIELDSPNTLRYNRVWSEAGWTAQSSRQAEFNALKTQLESEGFTVTVEQPDYI